MAIKLEKEDLESIMARAIESAMAARDNATPPASSAQVGEVNAVTATQPLKIANFWEDDPHTWFRRLEPHLVQKARDAISHKENNG